MKTAARRQRSPYQGVVLAAPVSVPYERYSIQTAHWWIARALKQTLAAASVSPRELDGFSVSSFCLSPDTGVGLAQHLGVKPPAKKNPQQRTRVPTLPPKRRSRVALGLAAAAAEGRFMLQVCGECAAVQYPLRDACVACLSTALIWKDVPRGGGLVAETTVRASTSAYFRERTPWRIGTVRLDCGPSVICHLHGDCEKRARVRMRLQLDRAGHGVLFATPEKDNPEMLDDPQLHELTCDPRYRRVLITDARSDNALALARAFVDAGASIIFAGEAEAWRPGPTPDAMRLLVEKRDIRGFGTETVSTDAGQGMHHTPPYPAHHFLHGAGKYGLQCLKDLDRLPPVGAILIAAPLKIKQGTGSPLRVIAIVPRAEETR